jgi:predicted GNAT family N-acyltransferase
MIDQLTNDFDQAALLAHYQVEMRRDGYVPGLPQQQLAEVTRYCDAKQREALIMWHHFAAEATARVVARELAYFASSEAFTWKVYADDAPANLPTVLQAAGFTAEIESALMVCAVDKLLATTLPPSEVDIQSLNERHEISRLREVWDQVWPGETSGWCDVLADELDATPRQLHILIANVNSAPVASGYLILDPRQTFAYLGGGATITSERGRGHYRRLVVARARIATLAKTRYLAVEASADSQQVLKKMGFTVLTTLRFFERP